MHPRRFIKCMLAAALIAWGLPVAIASCSDASPSAAGPDAGAVPDAPEPAADARADGAGDGSRTSSACVGGADASRCDGTNPTFVFYPPVGCDPAADAGGDASADAGDAGEAGAEGPVHDRCADVSKDDIVF